MIDEKLLEARLELLHQESKILDLRVQILDLEGFEDDYFELCWRYNDLVRLFRSTDTSLMFSAAKLASRHHAAVETKFIEDFEPNSGVSFSKLEDDKIQSDINDLTFHHK